jgi:hypothetical protein
VSHTFSSRNHRRCSTVVSDVITELCALLGIESEAEQQEFSLYCIVQGDAFTMPLSFDDYILDVTTELLKSGQPFYLIFCRSVWHFPLKRDPAPTPLYIEVLFNQVAPDYLEGLLLEIPNIGAPTPDYVRDMARIAAILHRAADLNHIPVIILNFSLSLFIINNAVCVCVCVGNEGNKVSAAKASAESARNQAGTVGKPR